ncbi:MAG: response regulator transcription factor [bacterium]
MYRLLIVEDEKPLRNKMVNNVKWQEEGYIIEQAANGKEALSILKEKNIDILITDIQMPEMGGLELMAEARKISDTIKIIIISGYAEFEYAQQAIRLGVDNYLLKPFRSERLLEAVKEVSKKIMHENIKRREIEHLRSEINDYFIGNDSKLSFTWLRDNQFFKEQSLIIDNQKLSQLLKTGTEKELVLEIEIILEKLAEFKNSKDRLYLLLNNVILTSFKIMKDLNYEFSDLMSIIGKENLEKINIKDSELIKQWLTGFLLGVNNLVRFNQDNRNKNLIDEMQDYIQVNYAEGITLNEIAQIFNVSSGYLSKLFFEQVGEKFTDYLNSIRLNKAKELLKTSDKKIYQIADEVGFNDSYYFSSWFKKLAGLSPSNYRENLDLL